MKKDIFTLLSGLLTAVLLFLTAIGVKVEWFTQESIDAFVFMVAAFAAFIINLYAIWKNTYVSKRTKKQKEALKEKGLM